MDLVASYLVLDSCVFLLLPYMCFSSIWWKVLFLFPYYAKELNFENSVWLHSLGTEFFNYKIMYYLFMKMDQLKSRGLLTWVNAN